MTVGGSTDGGSNGGGSTEPDGEVDHEVESGAERTDDEDLGWKGTALADKTLFALKITALMLAVIAVGFSVFGRQLELLDYKPGGSTFNSAVRPILLGLFLVGAVLALRWQMVGGAIAIFAAAGTVAFAFNQLITPHAIVTVAAFGLPGVLWVIADSFELNRRRAAIGLAATALLTFAGYRAGRYAYDRVWGPSHPGSETAALDPSPVLWVWNGSTTSDQTVVKAKMTDTFETARLAVSTSPDLSDPTWFNGAPIVGLQVVPFDVSDLEPDTQYHYGVEVDGDLDEVRTGTFTTFPEGPSSFTVAFGACARVGSNGEVFNAINDLDPLLYAIVGDFHYGDNDVDDLQRYQDVLDLTLTQPAQADLYRSTSVAYVWDDHDYGANNSNRNSTARLAAMASYRQYVPSYDLAGPFTALHQAFTIGRVRFVMTDARSSRNAGDVFDDENKTMLGDEQKAWFKREVLEASASHELVVWINPVPWVSDASEGADDWGGYSTERRELADYFVDNDIDNLVMVSGDAHMVAIDDGTNTDFSTEQAGGFPLLHAAALDRTGSTKGGPYSEGMIPGGGQFASMEVIDDGDEIEVVFTARRWDGETLLEYRFDAPGS